MLRDATRCGMMFPALVTLQGEVSRSEAWSEAAAKAFRVPQPHREVVALRKEGEGLRVNFEEVLGRVVEKVR